ncbi:type A Von Willebrand factor domain protein [Ichthyophthirius multifiliis]|uniref:Type A Von Willebrand factor domain protein n=1 Tax=Ichthyophthirius multifiliis TaxID=5932 RepID=G0QR68_ICHMU|nr:type A Von Willebrand factor domain protein [Ichthyophthirius multifiliis]EGR32285.1 type A Von Willebrand factor domain protein [Ichthyophthirius multifiliis]|eukprot:XP_004035771.1 type A Von Willebrand factor domain protein [Ichthyophthirius multifiliis]
MQFASKYFFKKSSKQDTFLKSNIQKEEENQLDTNVVQITFENTKESEKNIVLGDPIYCQQCQSILNKYSKLEKTIQENLQKWICEFCSHQNLIKIEQEEIPCQEETIYLLQGPLEQNKDQKNEDISVVFVIDISGSMSVTCKIENKEALKYKHNTKVCNEEFEALKQFMDPEDVQQYIQMYNQSQQFISRKQCVVAAIQQQLDDISEQFPNRKIGLIVFNDDVTIFGSGDKNIPPLVITGDKLQQEEIIYQICKENSEKMLNLKAQDCKENLINVFQNLKETGRTALGPALISALGLLSKQNKGSLIILCTDGLANIGVGAFDQQQHSQVFYENIKQIAVENDTVINVISIKGEGCKLDILGQLADKTGGNVTRVDPENIHKDFANILEDEVVAFKASMKIYIKNIMKFRNLDEQNDILERNGSVCIKQMGNVTLKTVQTFEYMSKSDEELQQEKLQINEKEKKYLFRLKSNIRIKMDKLL